MQQRGRQPRYWKEVWELDLYEIQQIPILYVQRLSARIWRDPVLLACVTDANLTLNPDYQHTGGPGRSSGITSFSWQSGDLQFKPRRRQLYLTTCTKHPSQLVTFRRDLATQHCKWSTQHLRSLRFFRLTCNNYYYQAFPPSSSPFLLSRRSPHSVLPIRAVDPSLRRGEACDGCKINSQPRLSAHWWSRTV